MAAPNTTQLWIAGEIPREAIHAELERILASAAFGKADRPRRFFRHLVETALRGEPQHLKESLLGIEVFGREASWDPRLDPIVRQEAARLRKRLARYYEVEGAGSAVRIELPVGAYVPVFQGPAKADVQADAPAVAEAAEERTVLSRRSAVFNLAAGVIAGVAVLTAGAALFWQISQPRSAAGGHPKAGAQDLYLKGMYYWQKRTPDSLTQAVDLFTQAIVGDPQYALAYVGLANTYNLLREFAAMPEQDAYPRALAAIRKALELDDRSAEAHCSLAFISYWWNWNALLAEREYRRAISLDPNYATAHHWYATFLHARARPREALAQIDIAQKLQPTSAAILADKGLLLYHAGERERAVELLRQLEADDPSLQSSSRYLAGIYLDERDYANYLAELRRSAGIANNDTSREIADAAEEGFAASGERGMLERILYAQENLHGRGLLPSYYLAETCSRLGKTSEALHYLEAASHEPGSLFLSYRTDSAFDPLRSRPEFQKLYARFEPKIAAGTLPPRQTQH